LIYVASPFETVILNMRDMGMFQFLLPFMLSSAVFFGLLRKSKIFGDPDRSVVINGVVSIVAAFMVWSAPILLGVDMETKMAAFFVQGTSATLVILVGLMMVSMFFPPDLAEKLGKDFLNSKTTVGGVVIFGLVVAIGIMISSGLIYLFIPADFLSSLGSGSGTSIGDVIPSALMVLLLLGTVFLIVWGGGKESK
jgi:hypothetical protein